MSDAAHSLRARIAEIRIIRQTQRAAMSSLGRYVRDGLLLSENL